MTRLQIIVMFIGLAAVLGVPSCADTDVHDHVPSIPVNRYSIDRITDVYEFQLKDGTRCVTVNYRGITCEWKK